MSCLSRGVLVYVCLCRVVGTKLVDEAIDQGARTVEDVAAYLRSHHGLWSMPPHRREVPGQPGLVDLERRSRDAVRSDEVLAPGRCIVDCYL